MKTKKVQIINLLPSASVPVTRNWRELTIKLFYKRDYRTGFFSVDDTAVWARLVKKVKTKSIAKNKKTELKKYYKFY